MKIREKNLKGKKLIEKKKSVDETSKDVICFHCRKRGHIKPNCPLLKKKFKFEKAKKALKAETWSDTECEDSDDDICLMAKSDSDSDSDSKIEIEIKHSDMTPEVSNYIDNLCLEFKAAYKRISSLKKEISSLRQQDASQKEKIDFLQKEFHQVKEGRDFLFKENEFLKKEILEITFKFSKGSETLKHILSIQIPYYNKSGLGFVKESDS